MLSDDYPHPQLRLALKRQADSLHVPGDKFDEFVADFCKRSIFSNLRSIAGIQSGEDQENYPGEYRELTEAIPIYQAAYNRYAKSTT